MSAPDCIDVCEIIIDELKRLGFEINDDEDHANIIDYLNRCRLVKDADKYTFEIDLKQFIEDNFAEELIEPTDEQIEQFKHYLEADLSNWISKNWRSFMANRGD
jgi:ketol-acid reductoisomerase